MRITIDPATPSDMDAVRRLLDETTDRFGQVAKPFNKNFQGQACEGSARWNAEEFTSLRVQSKSRKNAHGRPIAFDLIPQRQLPRNGSRKIGHCLTVYLQRVRRFGIRKIAPDLTCEKRDTLCDCDAVFLLLPMETILI